jgi:hypothetical protein
VIVPPLSVVVVVVVVSETWAHANGAAAATAMLSSSFFIYLAFLLVFSEQGRHAPRNGEGRLLWCHKNIATLSMRGCV